MRYGYVRVSTKEQNIDRQMSALAFENIPQNQIFIDRASGKDFDRTEYKKLLTVLQADDEIVIKSIDRLGRNYDEILEQWQSITKKKKVNITVLDFPLLNTKNSDDNITGKLISDIVLQVLSYVAQFEREQIKQRISPICNSKFLSNVNSIIPINAIISTIKILFLGFSLLKIQEKNGMKITDKLIRKLALVAVVYFTPIVIVINTKNNIILKIRE